MGLFRTLSVGEASLNFVVLMRIVNVNELLFYNFMSVHVNDLFSLPSRVADGGLQLFPVSPCTPSTKVLRFNMYFLLLRSKDHKEIRRTRCNRIDSLYVKYLYFLFYTTVFR